MLRTLFCPDNFDCFRAQFGQFKKFKMLDLDRVNDYFCSIFSDYEYANVLKLRSRNKFNALLAVCLFDHDFKKKCGI